MWLCGSLSVGGIPLTDKGLHVGCGCYGSFQVELYDCGKLTWNKGSRLKKNKSDVPFNHKSCTVYTFTHTQCEVRVCVHV